MGKGILKVEIALGLFFIFFGGTPWKRESGDLRLLWDYFSIIFSFWWRPLEKGVWRFEIALGLFEYIFGWQPLEKGVWRFEIAL